MAFKEVYCRPQPVNKSVPIIIGGHSEAAARRAGRLGDGFFPYTRGQVKLIAIAREAAEKAGRDPDKLEITTSLPSETAELEALQSLDVQRVLVPLLGGGRLNPPIRGPEDLAGWTETIKRRADA